MAVTDLDGVAVVEETPDAGQHGSRAHEGRFALAGPGEQLVDGDVAFFDEVSEIPSQSENRISCDAGEERTVERLGWCPVTWCSWGPEGALLMKTW